MTTKTDRELLELAARAAGYRATPDPYGRTFMKTEDSDFWNPLTNDGDALRLAVKLNLDVELLNDCVYANGLEVQNYQLFEWHKDDKCAATRRAIVRAAAAIGESMP